PVKHTTTLFPYTTLFRAYSCNKQRKGEGDMKKVWIGILLVGAVFLAWYSFTEMRGDRAGTDPEISAEAIKEQIAGQYSGEIQEMKLNEKDGNYNAVIKE